MIGKEISIDFRNRNPDKFPRVIIKEETDSHIRYHLEYEDGKAYYADVIRISSNGKYVLKIVDKI